MKINRVLPIIALSLVIVLSFTAGVTYSHLLNSDRSRGALPKEFNALYEVWYLLQDYYVNQSALDPYILSQGAIYGMLEALGDSYTFYYEDYGLVLEEIDHSFQGIGIFFSIDDGQLRVISPIAGTPADEAGILSGDIILEVDGESTQGFSELEAMRKIRGPKGTTVTLLIQRQGEVQPFEVQVVRDEINVPTVYAESISDDIAYIQITYFAPHAIGEFSAALSDVLQSGCRGIILDVRGNPGGYLYVVDHVADEFLDGGVIMYEASSDLAITDQRMATAGGRAVDIPVVILVNQGTASASEVLAGALQGNDRAKVIGTTTYGKGSVNILFELGDAAAFYLTVARWITPDMNVIEGLGISPDYVVDMTLEDLYAGLDPQLDYAVEYMESLLQ